MKRLFIGGQVFTLECLQGKRPPAEAVLVEDGKILATGSASDLRPLVQHGDALVDLQGGYLYPGFVDAHTHLTGYGASLRELLLSSCNTRQEALNSVRAYCQTIPEGEWVTGRRWDESRWQEHQYLTRQDLDSAAPKHPVFLLRIDGHLGVLNSLALHTLGIPSEKFPDGILKERALDEVRNRLRPSPLQREKDIQRGVQEALKSGVTAIHEITSPEDLPVYLCLWEKSQKAGEIQERDLKIRLYLIPVWEGWQEVQRLQIRVYNPESTAPRSDPWLSIRGVKFFADGSVGAHTALLSEDYSDLPGSRGEHYLPPDELEQGIREVTAEGFQPCVHAIGDAAIEQVLQIYERITPRTPSSRPRIEHFEMPSLDHIQRLKNLGGIASVQPNFIGEWGLPGGMYEERLGKERMSRMNPLWEIQRQGLHMCFGSDMMPFSPLYGIRCALYAPFRCQQIKEREAILAYTASGAYASFREHDLGSIEPGKWADFTLLNQPPSEMPRVLMTIVAGEVLYTSSDL